MGIGIAVVVLILLGLGARKKMTQFFYPVAPAMPAVVGESMPEILARLETVLQTNAPHVLAGLQPGLSTAEIAKLEERYQVRLPEDIKAIYAWHNGSAGTTNYLSGDFIPIHRFLPLEEALADHVCSRPGLASPVQMAAAFFLTSHRDSWISLFADGAGDGYWYDPKRPAAEGAVFYNFTETGTYEFFPSAKNLMAGIAKAYEIGIFRVKPGSKPPELDEDFERAQKFWDEFGASNPVP